MTAAKLNIRSKQIRGFPKSVAPDRPSIPFLQTESDRQKETPTESPGRFVRTMIRWAGKAVAGKH